MCPQPTTYTPEQHAAFVAAVKQYGYVAHACAVCRLDESKVYRWFARGKRGEEPYASFYADVKAALAQTMGELRALAAMQPGGAKWLLSKMDQRAYGDKDDRGSVMQELLDVMLPRLPEHCQFEVLRVAEEYRRELVGQLLGEPGVADQEEAGDGAIETEGERVEPRRLQIEPGPD